MSYIGTNNAQSTLAAGLTDSGTTLTIQSYDVALFPVINNGGVGTDYTYLTLQDSSNNIEVVTVTRHDTASSDFTVTRGSDKTTARAWSIGDVVALRVTAGMMNDFFAAVTAAQTAAAAAQAAAQSASGSVVGINPSGLMHLSGAETAGGAKTFTSPITIGSSWTIEQLGSDLVIKYGGAPRMKLASDGSLSVTGNVTAGATLT